MSELPVPGLFDLMLRRPLRPAGATARAADAALAPLVRRTYARIPFYQELWQAAGVSPAEIRGRADLARLPLVDKDMLVNAGAAARDPQADSGLPPMRTSGTSGRAIEIRRSRREMRVVRRAVLRHYLWGGLRPWWRVLTLGSTWLRDRRGVIVQRVVNTRFLDGQMPVGEQLEALLDFRPHALIGQTGGLYLLARELLRRDQTVRLRRVVPTGATLTAPMRAALRAAFGAPVLDMYGAIETGPIAWQCTRGEYHVDADRLIVEVVDAAGRPLPPGCPGQIVVTNLYAWTMPFIRYRLADIGAYARRSCACRCRFPVLEPVRGRLNDFLRTPAGDLVSPHFFFHIYDALPANPIRAWRVTQETERRLVFEYVPESDAGPSAIDHGVRQIRARFGAACEVAARQVAEIPLTPAGKQQCIVSRLRPPTRGWEAAEGVGDAAPWGGASATTLSVLESHA